MTSGCYPGVSRLYQHSSSRPAHNFRRKEVGTAAYLGVVAVPEICQKTCRNFHRKEAGTAAYLGVVAVPRDMPEGTFVTGLVWGTFGFSEHRHALAHYQPRGVYSKL